MFTAIAFYEFCYSVRRYMQMVYLQNRKGFQDLYLYVYKFKEFQDRISSKHVQSKLGFFTEMEITTLFLELHLWFNIFLNFKICLTNSNVCVVGSSGIVSNTSICFQYIFCRHIYWHPILLISSGSMITLYMTFT